MLNNSSLSPNKVLKTVTKPKFIMILAAINIVASISGLIAIAKTIAKLQETQISILHNKLAFITMVTTIIVAAFTIVASIGVLKSQKWAWKSFLVLYIYDIIRNCIAVANCFILKNSIYANVDVSSSITKFSIRAVLGVLLVVYLLRSNTMEYFKVNIAKRLVVLKAIGITVVFILATNIALLI